MSTPRSVRLERVAYALAAPVLVAAPNLDPTGPVNLSVLGGGAAATAAAYLATKSAEGAGRKMLRALPAITAAAVDLVATYTTGWGPAGTDVALAAGWAACWAAICPFARHARRHHRPSLAAAAQLDAAPTPADDKASALTRQARLLWERAGNPGATLLVHAHRHRGMRNDMTILLASKQQGRPITGVKEADVAAAFGVDEGDVGLAAVPRQAGRHGGPGWMEAHLTPDAHARRRQAPTRTEKWAAVAATGAATGSELVDVRRDDARGVTFYRARMSEPTETPQVDLAKLCRGLGEPDDDSRVFLLIDGAEFLLSVFDSPPLSRVHPATRELLTPNAKGMFVCGYSTTGQPVHNMIYQHDKNAPAHGLVLGVTRSGKTQYFAISMAAESLGGGVVWLGTVRRDEKTTALGQYIDRQGSNPIWMARALRAAKALCEIRAEMPWPHDGKPHDYKPGDPRCPYRPLYLYMDEYMTGTQDGLVGEDLQADGDDLTVTGLKYGIGFNPAGQSPFAHNGFSTEMKDNLRQNSRPVIFNMGSPMATRKAAEGTMENPYDVPTIPARYSAQEGSAIERAMAGEADPENGVSTGGVAVIVLDNGRAVLMRALYADFDSDLADLFPEEINRLTDHEISELETRGLWFDWNDPPYPGEFGPALDEDNDEDGDDEPPRGGKKRSADRTITTASDALKAIKSLDNA